MKAELVGLVKDALRGNVPVLELRGGDALARAGGDLDFMVPPSRAVVACALVVRAAVAGGWYVVSFRDIGYLAQVVLVRLHDDGSAGAMKLDFFNGLCWYGVGRDDAGRRLFEQLPSDPETFKKFAGAATFFQKALIVGRLSERDHARVVAAGADAAFIARMAGEIGLPISQADVDARGVQGFAKWRMRAASSGVRGLMGFLPWFLRASRAHLRFKLGTSTFAGQMIGISGMDGSGKSTVIDRLLGAFRQAGGAQPRLAHLLPRWMPLPHQLLRRKQTVTNYTRPYAEPPVSRGLGANVRLAYYVVAFTSAKLAIRVSTWRGHVVIMDRSVVDFLADPTRSRIPIQRLPRWLMRFMVPRGQLFYLNASPEVAVARKHELTQDKARRLSESYLNVCEILGVRCLDADATQEAVLIELLTYLSAECDRRITRAGTR